MHINHRRKNYQRYEGYYWGIHDYWWHRRQYWAKHRARVRHLMVNERYDEIQDRHPHSIWWDVYV